MAGCYPVLVARIFIFASPTTSARRGRVDFLLQLPLEADNRSTEVGQRFGGAALPGRLVAGALGVVETGEVCGVGNLGVHNAAQVADGGEGGCRGEDIRVEEETEHGKRLSELLGQRCRVGPVVRG